MPEPWLHRFLNVYWLRPENAVWRTVNCLAMEDIAFEEPSLDLACGDGIFSFLRAGGEFDPDFDIFSSVGSLDRFFAQADIYDAAPDDYRAPIRSQPGYRVTVGTDHKPNLLRKAEALDFYRELRELDHEQPLPFADGSFRTVFSNSVYWVGNVEQHLREIARVLQPDGVAVLVLKTRALLDYRLESLEPELGRGWLDLIDRGRAASYRGLRDEGGWQQLFDTAGLEVVSRRPQMTWVHAHIWDVGLRPLSPVLIRMTEALAPEARSSLKAEWVAVWEQLLEPFCRPGADLGRARPPAELVYVLRARAA